MPKTKPKRNPSTKSSKASQDKKNTQVLKTIFPLVLTLAFMVLLYVLVLLPKSPANSLRSAILNTLDSEKQTSFRYDGSFGDENRGIAGEYSGQKASNGDTQFRIRLKDEDLFTSIETINLGQTSYVRVEGVQNLTAITEGITGVKTPNPKIVELLLGAQNKWILLTAEDKDLVETAVPCMGLLPGYGSQTISAPRMTEENYPFELTAGPYIGRDDTEDRFYDAVLKEDRTATSPEVAFGELVNCLETAYGEDDFRLRPGGEADIQTLKFTFTVDPLSNTVRRMSVKGVGAYFQITLRDFNKDVSIDAPEPSVSLPEAFPGGVSQFIGL